MTKIRVSAHSLAINSKSAREICSFLKEAFEINKFDSVSDEPT